MNHICENPDCKKPIKRKRRPSGEWERPYVWKMRRFCNSTCRKQGRERGRRSICTPEQKKVMNKLLAWR